MGKEGYINIHLVPHTHDDVGWLKTVDQYYYGAKRAIDILIDIITRKQDEAVQYILDNVVRELEKDPNKRFVYVEMAYFWRWWNEQNLTMKQLVRTLVDEGRLEFVIGGWCMNDEATPYYTDMIDQQALGLKFILEEFGPCARPRSAWQIDPFGHSREQASLFSQFGFDGLFLGRIDYQDSNYRAQTKTREMLWQGSENLGDESLLFTGILPNGYGPPSGFCWDSTCRDEPIMDDPNMDEYNVDQKVNDFLRSTQQQATAYKTSNLIMTFGSDFQYSNARRWFKNIDKLIYYVNRMQVTNSSKVNLFYSTPACYLYSLNKANATWPIKYDDFFPYAHKPHAFWTGYFTSRAALKFNVRKTSRFLQTVRQLVAFANLKDDATSKSIGLLERAMGEAQHHDAVSGTEKQHVADDYAKRLWSGTAKCVNVVENSLNAILKMNLNATNKSPIIYCPLLNSTECLPIEDKKTFTIVVYNPLSRSIQSWISLPVLGSKHNITEAVTGKTVISDSSLVYPEIRLLKERKSLADYNLVFKADLPPLGFKVYNVKRLLFQNDNQKESMSLENKNLENFIIKNEFLELDFDSNGNLLQVKNLNQSLSTRLNQSLCYYHSMQKNTSDPSFVVSGAYLFRPLNNTPTCFRVKDYSIFRGKQFTEIHQIFNDWLSQTIRLNNGTKHVEFEWQVGHINILDLHGKEAIMKFESDLKSNSIFYTDSNGREILKRKRNFRPTWDLTQTEPISGNYYPINSRIFIRDEVSESQQSKINDLRQLTFLNDRSQGGSSIEDGNVEIMLHRRMLYDDHLGVGEALDERIFEVYGLVVKGVVCMTFDTIDNSARLHRELAHQINNRPLLTFSVDAAEEKNLNRLSGWSAIVKSLPENLHLLTLSREFHKNNELNSILVRIEHFYEKGEDQKMSQPVTIDLKDVFNRTFNFTGIEELALGGNMRVEELNDRLKWNAQNNAGHINVNQKSKKLNQHELANFTVTFNPMQIRTFRLFFIPN